MAWLKRNTPTDAPEETTAPAPDTASDEAPAAAEPVTPVTSEDDAPLLTDTASPADEDASLSGDSAADPTLRIQSMATRRRRGLAALGLVVLIFAVIGMVSTIITGMQLVRRARDTSYLKEEMYYTLLPLMQYAPVAFDDPDESKQDALIQAALYDITNREWIRQQQDSQYVSPYTVDEYGRTAIPIADVTAAYNNLFGVDTIPYCHTFGEDGGVYFTYQYDEENQLYYVPYSEVFSAYRPVLDTIQRAGRIYKVRVGYVHSQDITVDDHGNTVVDVTRATYYQIYTVERLEDDHFVIRSVSDEQTDTAATTAP